MSSSSTPPWRSLLVAVAMTALVALPAMADAATPRTPDFRVAVPSAGDMTVAVVTLKGAKLRHKRQRGKRSRQRLPRLRARVVGRGHRQVAVLGSVIRKPVGNRVRRKALVVLARPGGSGREARASALLDDPTVAIEIIRANARSRKEQAGGEPEQKGKQDELQQKKPNDRDDQLRRKQEQRRKLEEQRRKQEEQRKQQQQRKQDQQRKLEDHWRKIEEQRRKIEEERRKLQEQRTAEQRRKLEEQARKLEQQQRELEEQQRKLEQQAKFGSVLGKLQSKDVLEHVLKTSKVLGDELTAERLLKRLTDGGGEKKIAQQRELAKRLREAFLDKKVEQRKRAQEILKKSLESRKCVDGAVISLCDVPPRKPLPKPPKPPGDPVQLPPATPKDPVAPKQPSDPADPDPADPADPVKPQVAVELSYGEDGGGVTFCVAIATEPPQPGASGTFVSHEADAEPPFPEHPFELDEDGRALVPFERYPPGDTVFRTEVTVEWPEVGPVTEVVEGPGFGSRSEECGAPLS